MLDQLAASIPNTASTASRRPGMMGLPPKIPGLTLMRFNKESWRMVCPQSRPMLRLLMQDTASGTIEQTTFLDILVTSQRCPVPARHVLAALRSESFLRAPSG